MPLVSAKCTNCGANLSVDNTKEAAICEYCGFAFVVEKAINNYNINNNIKADVVNIYGGKNNSDIDNQYNILTSVLSTDEDAKILEAKKALEKQDRYTCRNICEDIVYKTNGKSRRAWELLIENEFKNYWSKEPLGAYDDYDKGYYKCIVDTFSSEKKVEERYEEFVRNSYHSFVDPFARYSGATDYIKGYLSNFNDAEAKSFILSFKDKINLLYKSMDDKKVPLKKVLDNALSKSNTKTLRLYSHDKDMIDNPIHAYLWEDAAFYYLYKRGYHRTPNVYVLQFSSGEIVCRKTLNCSQKSKSSFFTGKDKTYYKVELSHNDSDYYNKGNHNCPFAIDNYIFVGGNIFYRFEDAGYSTFDLQKAIKRNC